MYRSHAKETVMWNMRDKTLHNRSQLQQNDQQLNGLKQPIKCIDNNATTTGLQLANCVKFSERFPIYIERLNDELHQTLHFINVDAPGM